MTAFLKNTRVLKEGVYPVGFLRATGESDRPYGQNRLDFSNTRERSKVTAALKKEGPGAVHVSGPSSVPEIQEGKDIRFYKSVTLFKKYALKIP
jgi:hypothetical protein